MSSPLVFDVGRRTHVGKVRDHNEDSFAIREPSDLVQLAHRGRVYVVADGMGGHSAGDVASTAAVQTVVEWYFADRSPTPRAAMAEAVTVTNERIRDLANRPGQQGMGTTLVAAIVKDNRVLIANVGDSRAYLIRKGEIRQVSEDHSWVAEAVAAGHLTPAEARIHPRRNAITRSMGTRPNVTPDFFEEPFEPGDVLVLCSDGLTGQVPDEVIRRTVEQHGAQTAADKLVDLANDAGGPDNITVVVVRHGPPPRSTPSPIYAIAAALLALLVTAGVVVAAYGGGSNPVSAVTSQGALPTETAPALLESTVGAINRAATSTPAPNATETPTPTAIPSATPVRVLTPQPTVGGSILVPSAPPPTQPAPTQPIVVPPTATVVVAVATPSFFAPTNTPAPSPTNRPPGGGGDDGGGGGCTGNRC